MKHTKLPWDIVRALDHDEYARIFGRNQQDVGTEMVTPEDIRLENAEHIVRCVNAHETLTEQKAELLTACEAALAQFEGNASYSDDDKAVLDAMAKAIAKATN